MQPWINRLLAWLRQAPRAVRGVLVTLAVGSIAAAALAGPPRDRLTLLVPDDANANSWEVKVWTDSAAEEGIRVELLRDAAFLAMGNQAAAKIGGLIVPDSAHLRASDKLIEAIKQYTYLGGNLLLVYDAGVLTDGGFYPLAGNSRFADLVGVDYVFYNTNPNTMVGFGPVVGTQARLESLSFPPGKSLPYVASASMLASASNTAFVPANRFDPGGTKIMAPMMSRRAAKAIEDGSASVRRLRPRSLRELLGIGIESSGPLRFDRRNAKASKAADKHVFDRTPRQSDEVQAIISNDSRSYQELKPSQFSSDDGSLRTISGYAFGPLGYFHYVTTGEFPGTVYLSSPEHGLVAGTRAYGSGKLLFVNWPLGYFKAIGTDAAPLHGFLNLFAREHVGVSTLSVQPRGVGGLIYNWHIDDGDDLILDTKFLLDKTKVLERGPFSLHLTAGPDVITFGDGLGMNLNGSKPARDLLKRLTTIKVKKQKNRQDDDDDDEDDDDDNKKTKSALNHQIGSHGGWIHDYWGLVANEANSPNLTSLLTDNFDAIEKVTGRKIREYSSPQGNTPRWAVNWLEQRGVVAMYMVSDVGAGMVRSWRDGTRLADKIWTSPVTPLGKYATFEEFEEFGITDDVSGQWLLDLQSFVINRRTNRMFYTHPPGVTAHLAPITTLLDRADKLNDKSMFQWYTMAEMADFSQRRVQTVWGASTVAGKTTFSASNPTSLSDVSWLLPRTRFIQPAVVAGKGNVSSNAKFWIVTAEGGTSFKFATVER